ncbi:MAG: tandem-95 repeat protein [Pirellulales bacterium]|nr:tandem-95 repeat protein [Pirellulales bacterium]
MARSARRKPSVGRKPRLGEALERRDLLAVDFVFLLRSSAFPEADPGVLAHALAAAEAVKNAFNFTDIIDQFAAEPPNNVIIPIVLSKESLLVTPDVPFVPVFSGAGATQLIPRTSLVDYTFVRNALFGDALNEPDDGIVGALPLPGQLKVEARFPYFWNNQLVMTKTQMRSWSAFPPLLDPSFTPYALDDEVIVAGTSDEAVDYGLQTVLATDAGQQCFADAQIIFDSNFKYDEDGDPTNGIQPAEDGVINVLDEVIYRLLETMGLGTAESLVPKRPPLGFAGQVPITIGDLFRFADNLPGKDPQSISDFQTFARSISPSVNDTYDDGTEEFVPAGLAFFNDNNVVFPNLLDQATAQFLDLIGWDIDTNAAPNAVTDVVNVPEDTSIVINILANDFDVDGAIIPSTVQIAKLPDHGTIAVNPVTGQVTYTPFANYNGPDNFRYSVADNDTKRSSVANVNITVVPVNDLPVAGNDQATTAINAAVFIPVLVNDADVDGSLDPATIEIVTNPTKGIALPQANGGILYTPSPGQTGGDLFEYRVKDTNGGLSNTARVTIRIGAPVQLAGQVYADLNNNGVRDPGEAGIPGVMVTLRKDDGPYTFQGLIVTTDADGQYLFAEGAGKPVLPGGVYTIVEIHPQQFNDGIDTAGAPAPGVVANDLLGTITLTPGGAAIGFNFGERGLRADAAAANVSNRFFLATDAAPQFLSSLFITGNGTGDGTSATFVANLYYEVLFREGDAYGVSYWTTQLNTGAMSRTAVVNAFLNSYEYRGNLIKSYFQKYLGRDIDNYGLGQFFTLMNAGWTEEQVLAFILGSPEYYAKHGGTTSGFTTALFADLLGRVPSATDVQQLSRYSRTQLIDIVLSSDEMRGLLLDGNVSFGGWYDRYLGRNADTPSKNTFLQLLRSGGWNWRAVQSYLLSSNENFL